MLYRAGYLYITIFNQLFKSADEQSIRKILGVFVLCVYVCIQLKTLFLFNSGSFHYLSTYLCVLVAILHPCFLLRKLSLLLHHFSYFPAIWLL